MERRPTWGLVGERTAGERLGRLDLDLDLDLCLRYHVATTAAYLEYLSHSHTENDVAAVDAWSDLDQPLDR